MALGDFLASLGQGANLLQNFDQTRQARGQQALKTATLVADEKRAAADEKRREAEFARREQDAERLRAQEFLNRFQLNEPIELDPNDPDQQAALKYYKKEFTAYPGQPNTVTLRPSAQRQRELQRVEKEKLEFDQLVRAGKKAEAQDAMVQSIQALKSQVDPKTGKSAWDRLSLAERAGKVSIAGMPDDAKYTDDEAVAKMGREAWAKAGPQLQIAREGDASAERVATISAAGRAGNTYNVQEKIGMMAKDLLESNSVYRQLMGRPSLTDKERTIMSNIEARAYEAATRNWIAQNPGQSPSAPPATPSTMPVKGPRLVGVR